MARKKLSATITDGTTNSPGDTMILNFEVTGALAIAGGVTKFCSANGYCEVAGDLTNADPSDKTQNFPYQAFVCPVAGTISNAYYYGNVPAAAQHHIATLMRNGVATSVVLDVVAADDDGQGNAKLANNVNTVNVSPGDLLSWKLASGAGANSMIPGISCKYA